jgi:hypothetical protein
MLAPTHASWNGSSGAPPPQCRAAVSDLLLSRRLLGDRETDRHCPSERAAHGKASSGVGWVETEHVDSTVNRRTSRVWHAPGNLTKGALDSASPKRRDQLRRGSLMRACAMLYPAIVVEGDQPLPDRALRRSTNRDTFGEGRWTIDHWLPVCGR